MTYDVVVVGSGGGALIGAYLAQQAGLKTVVLERTDLVGGTSAYSGGSCWLPGTEVQQRAGLSDSTDGARSYLEALLSKPLSTSVEVFLAESPKLVAQLEADDAFEWEWSPFPEYFDAPGRVPMGRSIQPTNIRRDELSADVSELVRPPVERDRAGEGGRNTLSGGQALIARTLMAFVRDGGTVLTNHHVTDYIVEDGRVVGVTTADGETIRAERGVIVAAGGFEGNDALRTEHGVPGTAEWTMAPAGTNTGELIEAGQALGAAIDHMDQGWLCPGLEQPGGGGSFTLGFRGGVMVDADGHRYANESLPYDQFGIQMAGAPNRIPSYFVFDSREGGSLPAIAMPEGDPAEHLKAGTWVQADTVDELAAKLGLTNLGDTVKRFNTFAENGVDEDFARGTDEYDNFFTGGATLIPLETPPYIAARFVLSDLGTKGGMVIDEHGRVVRADGEPIPGLYATSNSAASIFGSFYPGPGAPLGQALVFASRAVQHITGAAE